jgi:hypothetical protein
MTEILLKAVSRTINGHIKDKNKRKQIMDEFKIIIEKILSTNDVDLVYEIETEENCEENDGDEYNETLHMTKDEFEFINNLFKEHTFKIVEMDFSSGGHGCVLHFDPNKMWNSKTRNGNYKYVIPCKDSSFIELLADSLWQEIKMLESNTNHRFTSENQVRENNKSIKKINELIDRLTKFTKSKSG